MTEREREMKVARTEGQESADANESEEGLPQGITQDPLGDPEDQRSLSTHRETLNQNSDPNGERKLYALIASEITISLFALTLFEKYAGNGIRAKGDPHHDTTHV
jgi:hypothetical protein